ncbi:MAG: DUF485 domain-containing protein [Alphaproteobacteria bacterium]|nr:DUF485 domain-containing protein [Alphaproteobacteria bacterium]
MTHSPKIDIRSLPEYQALIEAKSRIGWILSLSVIIVYFALILFIAFAPASLGTAIGSGVTSVGIVLGLGVIFFCFLVTGYYVHYANTKIEPLSKALLDKVGGGV